MKKALLIGINYTGMEHELHGCINDVSTMYNYLTNKFGYNPLNVRMLIDQELKTPPTKEIIQLDIKWLVSDLYREDELVFYYSGHGGQIPDKNNDEPDALDECIIPLDYKTNGVITDDWMFENLISKIPNGCKLTIFTDCCHAESILDLPVVYRYDTVPNIPNKISKIYNPSEWSAKFNKNLNKRPVTNGRVIHFAGCLDSQTSADATFNGNHQGAFSKCLIDTINSHLKTIKKDYYGLYDTLKEINCRLAIERFDQRVTLSFNKDFMCGAFRL